MSPTVAQPGGYHKEGVLLPLDNPDMLKVLENRRPCDGKHDAYFPRDTIHPDSDAKMHDSMYDRARKICSTCPVLENCITYALGANEVGTWGGTTEDDRKILEHERKSPERVKRRAHELALKVRERARRLPDIAASADEEIIPVVDPISELFTGAAARLAGRRLQAHHNIAPKTVLDIAKFVVAEGIDSHQFTVQYNHAKIPHKPLDVHAVDTWANRIEGSLALVDTTVADKVLRRVSTEELTALDATSPRYHEGIYQALRLRAMTQRIDVTLPDLSDLRGRQQGDSATRRWAEENKLKPAMAQEYLHVAWRRFGLLPSETQIHLMQNPPIIERRAS